MLIDWSDIVVVMSWASGMCEGNAEIFVAQYSLDVGQGVHREAGDSNKEDVGVS